MKAAQIYGLLMIAEVTPRQIAEELGVYPKLVTMVVRGERGQGPDARRVRARIAEILQMDVADLWSEPGSDEAEDASEPPQAAA